MNVASRRPVSLVVRQPALIRSPSNRPAPGTIWGQATQVSSKCFRAGTGKTCPFGGPGTAQHRSDVDRSAGRIGDHRTTPIERHTANMIEATTPVALKTCCECGRFWPVTEFRFHNRKTGLRHTQCRQCYNAYMRAYVAKRRAKTVGEFVTRLNRTRLDLGPLELLCIVLFRRFGGPVHGGRTVELEKLRPIAVKIGQITRVSCMLSRSHPLLGLMFTAASVCTKTCEAIQRRTGLSWARPASKSAGSQAVPRLAICVAREALRQEVGKSNEELRFDARNLLER